MSTEVYMQVVKLCNGTWKMQTNHFLELATWAQLFKEIIIITFARNQKIKISVKDQNCKGLFKANEVVIKIRKIVSSFKEKDATPQ